LNNTEEGLNALGYRLLSEGNIVEAIKVLKTNVQTFPESWNACDSLAEAYAVAGRTAKAIHYYTESLRLNPGNENARRMLGRLKTVDGKDG